eukprot:TRINITY_DN16021_c0_g1_i1.p1 TRINITY_DN16021_c0_g1~~TRINITY_DN16021_c0_g1_i1.p1  ORF type:complete len:379 (+),score=117.30 TRINITY_DN16021_c0_g1_i1:53-1138(+)
MLAPDVDRTGSQGDQLLARKLQMTKQLPSAQPERGWAASGAAPPAPAQPPAPTLTEIDVSTPDVSGGSAMLQPPSPATRPMYAWQAASAAIVAPRSRHPPPGSQEELEKVAALRREEGLAQFKIDRDKQRHALYNAWPGNVALLQQQVALLQQELAEKDRQLLDAQQDIRVLTHELEQQRQQHGAEVRRVKVENLSQLIRTFQTDGLRGLEGLARMQQSGQFQDEREKERQRVHELERGVMHDMEAMRREYEDKLKDMKEEYQVRLNWLAHRQAQLEAGVVNGHAAVDGAATLARSAGCDFRRQQSSVRRSQSQSRVQPPSPASAQRRAPYAGLMRSRNETERIRAKRDSLARGFYARRGF